MLSGQSLLSSMLAACGWGGGERRGRVREGGTEGGREGEYVVQSHIHVCHEIVLTNTDHRHPTIIDINNVACIYNNKS